MMSCPRANAARVKYLQLGRLQHVNKSCTIYDTGMGGGQTSLLFICLSWTTVTGCLSADSDLFRDNVNVILRADMQSAETYIYIDIIGEGSFAGRETIR